MPDLLDASGLFDQHAFENNLPIPDAIDTAHRTSLTIQVRQFEQFLGLYNEEGDQLTTTVWGYKSGNLGGYPGPTIIAYEGQPITVRWQNMLPVDGHLLPVDTSVHIAEPVRRPLEAGFVPIVTHLHGGTPPLRLTARRSNGSRRTGAVREAPARVRRALTSSARRRNI